jgi:hemerythrin superfamily protein
MQEPAAGSALGRRKGRIAQRKGNQIMAQQEFTDAIALLKADHREVEELFAKFEGASGDGKKQKIAEQICTELKIHTTIEEEIFYPAYRDAVKKKDDRELYQEALEEHHVVDLVLPELKASNPAGEIFGAKAKVLKELIEHHADEEEEEMFPKARKVLGAARLRDLGGRMETRKRTLMRRKKAR